MHLRFLPFSSRLSFLLRRPFFAGVSGGASGCESFMAALGNYATVGFEDRRGALDLLMDDTQALAYPHQPINQLQSARLRCEHSVRRKP